MVIQTDPYKGDLFFEAFDLVAGHTSSSVGLQSTEKLRLDKFDVVGASQSRAFLNLVFQGDICPGSRQLGLLGGLLRASCI